MSDLRGVGGPAYLNMQSRIKMCICVLKYAEFPECIKKYSIAYFNMQKQPKVPEDILGEPEGAIFY